MSATNPKMFTNAWRRKMRDELATVGAVDTTWTPVLDGTDIDLAEFPVTLAGKAAQVTGLVSTADWNGLTVSNGNVAIFNQDVELVAVLGAV